MGVSLEPIQCACGRLCAFAIRGGRSHHIYGDPYEYSGVLAMSGEVRAFSGARPRYKELAQAAAGVGLKIWWRRKKAGAEYEVR